MAMNSSASWQETLHSISILLTITDRLGQAFALFAPSGVVIKLSEFLFILPVDDGEKTFNYILCCVTCVCVQVNTEERGQKCRAHLLKNEHVDIRKPWLLLLLYLIHAANRLVCILYTHSKPHECIKPLHLVSLMKTCRKLWKVMIWSLTATTTTCCLSSLRSSQHQDLPDFECYWFPI